MTELVEDTRGKIRDLPIDSRLKGILISAAEEVGIDKIRVTSGGQCARGTCQKRTGSTRHDLGRAADLEIWKGGRALEFTSERDLPIFKAFVKAVARLCATGVGAGVEYMGEKTIHVGFGSRAIWGADGAASNAPDWLKVAAQQGWREAPVPPSDTFVVMARDGQRLRSGPGTEFAVISTLKPGTVVNVIAHDGANKDWARIDLRGDGQVDGHLHQAFLTAVDLTESDINADDLESCVDE